MSEQLGTLEHLAAVEMIRELAQEIERLKVALREIASLGAGPEVRPSLDGLCAAGIARKCLAGEQP